MTTNNCRIGHCQNRRRINQHQVVVFTRPVHQFGKAFAHQQFRRIWRYLTARDQVKFGNRGRFSSGSNIALTNQNFRQAIDVIGAQQLVGVAFAHIAVDQQHPFIGLADHRRQVGADKGFTD